MKNPQLIYWSICLVPLMVYYPGNCATVFVSPAGSGTDGLSWVTAFNSIVEAVGSAASGDQIWVASGAYNAPIAIPEGVSVYGGFFGNENDLEERDVTAYRAFIGSESEITTGGGSGGTSFLVRCADSTILDGFHISNSPFIDEELNRRHAGLLCTDGTMAIRNCVISNVQIANAPVFEIRSATVEVFRTRVANNAAIAHVGGFAGFAGVRVINGLAVLEECQIEGNSGETVFCGGQNSGGGIYAEESHLEIRRCVIQGNSVSTCATFFPPGGRGSSAGGGIFASKSIIFAENSIFERNMSSGCSAIRSEDSELLMLNCTIAGNSGVDGREARPICHSSPFTEREATLINCIVTDDNTVFLNQPLNWVHLSYCDVTGGYPGEGNIDADPRFVDPANGDYHLQRGSPCIESGTDTGLTHDFDGNARPVGDYDMGAFEYPFLRSDINSDGRVDQEDLLIFRGDWKLTTNP